MISVSVTGGYKKANSFLERLKNKVHSSKLDHYGKMGVAALKEATPVDSGITADSWDYRIEHKKDYVRIVWTNSCMADEVPIAILLHYGHASRDGSYVEGTDFVNTAMAPIFDKIIDEFCKEVRQT